MNIFKSTNAYERWLSGFVQPIAADLKFKHESMRSDVFTFFRATFYLWAQLWPQLPASISKAPRVLAVGDAHVENFGTWRDQEGRLVWGVNDFDEAAVLPYTNDLVRLAVSGVLARARGGLRIAAPELFDALLLGYSAALSHGGSPFTIEEQNHWLRKLAQGSAREPKRYWAKFTALNRWRGSVPKRAAELIANVPSDARLIRIVHRLAGAGSLGRPRLAGVYEWRGGYIAREVKARAPSAWIWANDGSVKHNATALPRIWERAVRCQDPYLRVTRRWIAKRVGPDCSRIDLASLPRVRQETALLRAMGWETANIHLGSGIADQVREHLQSLDRNWVADASDIMAHAIRAAFREWQRR
jgi:uncharacterized protein (DUF2252 family)